MRRNVIGLSTPQSILYQCLLGYQHYDACKIYQYSHSAGRHPGSIYSYKSSRGVGLHLQVMAIAVWGGCARRNLTFFTQTQVFGLGGFNCQVPGAGTEIMLCFCCFYFLRLHPRPVLSR